MIVFNLGSPLGCVTALLTLSHGQMPVTFRLGLTSSPENKSLGPHINNSSYKLLFLCAAVISQACLSAKRASVGTAGDREPRLNGCRYMTSAWLQCSTRFFSPACFGSCIISLERAERGVGLLRTSCVVCLCVCVFDRCRGLAWQSEFVVCSFQPVKSK